MKIGTTKNVTYVALGFEEGLIDLILTVRRPNGDLYEFATGAVTELALTEVAEGIYKAEYIPDELGVWTEKVVSVSNGDKAINSFSVVEKDLSNISSEVSAVESKIDAVKVDTEAIDGKIDAIDAKIDSVEGKVDAVQSDVTAIDGKVDVLDGKSDAIKTDTEDIKTAIGNLPMYRAGGYFA